MGDDYELQTRGIGRIDLDHGFFSDVLYVPDLAANLLSIYQMTHIGEPKTVIFTTDFVEIYKISTDQVVAVGYANIMRECTNSLISSLLPVIKHFTHMPMRFPNYGMRGLAT